MLKCELKRIFAKKLNRMMLIAAALLAVMFSAFAVGSMRYVDEDGGVHTGISASRSLTADRNRWEGILTAEKFTKIVKNEKKLAQQYPEEIPDTEFGKTVQSYDDIINFIVSVSLPDSDYDESVLHQLTEEQIENLYSTYEHNVQKMIDEYGKTPEQKKFLAKQYDKIKMPFYYQAKDSWNTMAVYAETYGIVLAVIIGFLVSGIFDEEFRTGAEAVFFSTKYGRSKAIKNKIIAGLLVTTTVYWTGVGILTLLSFGIMGTSGFQTPYQIEQPYSIYYMTYGQYYFAMVLCGYIASLFAASLTMLVTVKMHTRNVAAGIPFFLYCLMPFIGRALSSFTTFFNLMPYVLLNIMECAKDPAVFQLGNVVFRQIPLVMLLYIILSMLLLPFEYRSFGQYGYKR